ncbi:MAG: 3-hydroxyacyl-ACP dehydratase FabZ family protein [Planctomycetota bacterium]
MPTAPLIDFDSVQLDHVVATAEDIRKIIMQRGRFEMLDGIAHIDTENDLIVGFTDVAADAWWAADHVPGRPLFPGALMIEAAAQLCTFDFMKRQPEMTDTFVGFAGVDRVRYRGTVEPECRMYFAGRVTRIRRTMFTYSTQGFVDRKLVYEGDIMGMVV